MGKKDKKENDGYEYDYHKHLGWRCSYGNVYTYGGTRGAAKAKLEQMLREMQDDNNKE